MIENDKLRIIPLGGAKGIKRLYTNLIVPYEEFKSDIKGKIFMLLDTDEELLEFDTRDDYPKFKCKRMVNSQLGSKLVKLTSNPKSPKTEIEDILNGKIVYNLLKEYKEDYPELLEFIDTSLEKEEKEAFYSLNLRPSETISLNSFYDINNIKFDFAKKYITLNRAGNITPTIITEIKSFFESQ